MIHGSVEHEKLNENFFYNFRYEIPNKLEFEQIFCQVVSSATDLGVEKEGPFWRNETFKNWGIGEVMCQSDGRSSSW